MKMAKERRKSSLIWELGAGRETGVMGIVCTKWGKLPAKANCPVCPAYRLSGLIVPARAEPGAPQLR